MDYDYNLAKMIENSSRFLISLPCVVNFDMYHILDEIYHNLGELVVNMASKMSFKVISSSAAIPNIISVKDHFVTVTIRLGLI